LLDQRQVRAQKTGWRRARVVRQFTPNAERVCDGAQHQTPGVEFRHWKFGIHAIFFSGAGFCLKNGLLLHASQKKVYIFLC
jgi:hypothetical protein